jgi:hypothetical protein
VCRQPGEKPRDFGLAQVARMPLLVEDDEATNPIEVSLFGSNAQVPHPDGIPHLVQKARLAVPAVNDLQEGHGQTYGEAYSICQVSSSSKDFQGQSKHASVRLEIDVPFCPTRRNARFVFQG